MSVFTLKLDCDSELWHRFNIYLSVVCFDADNTQIGFFKFTEKSEQGAQKNQALEFTITKCNKIKIHLYIIPEVFPHTKAVDSSPIIMASLSILSQGKPLHIETIEVDQLGGGSISGKEITL